MRTKIASKVGAALLAGGILFSGVFAVQAQAQTLRDELQTRADQVITNRCDRVTAKVDERISLYDQNKQAHIERYGNIKTAVTNLITKLQAQGYDTTEVAANLRIFDQKVKDAAAAYTTFIETLKTSKTYACGNSEGQFRDTVKQALVELKDFRTKTQDAIDFVRTTLRPSIQSLRDQKPVKSNS